MKKALDSKTTDVIKETYLKTDFISNPTGYFYDLSRIDENIDALSLHKPLNVDLFFAMKANSYDEVMRRVVSHKEIEGIEIASSNELEEALNYVDASKIIFTGPGKTDFELECALKRNIKFINVESVAEAVRIQKIAEKQAIKNVDILLRINLDYSISSADEKMSGVSTKMGIDQCEVLKACNIIGDLDRISIKGIHVFAASGVLDYVQLLKCNRYIFELVKTLEGSGIAVDVIDFGGGIGIDYSDSNKEFDTTGYFESLRKLIEEFHYEKKSFIMELGTAIVGSAGFYTAKIIDIKKVKGKKHIVIAGGVNHMGLPLEMRRQHPVRIIKCNNEPLYEGCPYVENELVDISGPLCMVTDKLAWDTYVESAEIGDIVVFLQAGAYCYGEGMINFLNHPWPRQIVYESKGV